MIVSETGASTEGTELERDLYRFCVAGRRRVPRHPGANWNQARIDRVEYEAALARLDAEIEVNLSSLDASDVEIEKSLATGSLALTTLQSCTDSESNRQIVAAGIEEIRGTEGLHPRRNALDEITSNPRLLAQQSAAERQRFSEMLYYFDVLQQTA